MGDYISRADAYKTLTDYYHHRTEVQHMALRDALERVPAAEVKPVVRGKWGKDGDCPVCGCQPWYERDIHTLNYCPSCGADMREDK